MLKATSYIYIITDGTDYKIGVTKNDPSKRMKGLQTGNSRDLELFSTFKVPADKVYKLEKEAHKEIQKQCVKRGEWFKNISGWHINVLVDMICDGYIVD